MKKAAILLFLLVAVAYGNSLSNGFLWDDFDTITDNPSVRSWRGAAIVLDPGKYFRLSGEIGWRPLTTLSFFLDYSLWQLDPRGYHLTNLVLHYLCCLLLYAFAREISSDRPALLAAALFAVHPVNTEAVDAISFRDDLLCLVFMLASLKLSMRRRGIFSLPAAALYLLALLSKEMAYPLPLILLAVDVLYGRRLRPAGRALCRYLPFLVAAGAYSLLRFGFFLNPAESGYGFYGGGLGNRLLLAPAILTRYLLLLSIPVKLSADHAFGLPYGLFSAPAGLRLFLSTEILCLGALFTAVVAAALSRARKDLLFSFLFFVLTFGMLSNVVPLPNILAERYLYVPAVPFCLFAAILFAASRTGRIAAFVVLAAYISLTASRNHDWRDEGALWASTARVSPGSFRAHNHLGMLCSGEGKMEEAIGHLEKSLAINPRNGQAHNNLGLVYLRLGGFDEAERAFRRALEIGPGDATAYNNMGNLFMQRGERAAARRYYERAAAADERLTQPRFNLAALCEAEGDPEAALGHLDALIASYPEMSRAWLMKGRVLEGTGRMTEAVTCYERASSLFPVEPSNLVALGNALFLSGRYDEALERFGEAALFEETRAGALLNRGNCYMKKGDPGKAAEEYRLAIRSDGSMWEARSNLGIAYERAGMRDEAAREMELSLRINPAQEEIRMRLDTLKAPSPRR